MEKRNIIIRLLAGLGWLILIYFITNMSIGAIVGGIAASGSENYEAAFIAGQNASINFFRNYGLFVLIGQLVLFVVLAFAGLLPGTTKYKKD